MNNFQKQNVVNSQKTAASAAINHLSLRPAQSSDESFLKEVYAAARREEFSPLGWNGEQLKAFLKMQFDFQKQSYRMQFPDAKTSVIESGGVPAGRMIVDRNVEEIRLLDIALLPEFRGRGIGTFFLEELQREAAAENKSLVLQVLKINQRAFALYERRGFIIIETDDLYHSMRWREFVNN